MIIFREQGLCVDEIRVVHISGKNGKVISDRTFPRDKGFWHNLLVRLGLRHDTVVVNGFQAIINYLELSGQSATSFTNVGIGTGTTPSAVGDSQLQTPLVIASAVATKVTTTNTNDTMNLAITFSQANQGSLTGTAVAVTEVGVFNGTVNGTSIMLMHQVYSPSDVMNWNQGDQLIVTVKVQAKQG
jgi:hypothetical protein